MKAQEYARNEKYVEAIKLLETKIDKRNRKYSYYFFHGYYMLSIDNNNNSREALTDFLSAYEYDSSKYLINYFIGYTYYLISDNDNAAIYLENACKLFVAEKDKPAPYRLLAEVYYDAGRFHDALVNNELALRSQKDDSYLLLQKGMILARLGKKEELAIGYSNATQVDPQNKKIEYYYIHCLLEIGNYTESKQLLEKLLVDKSNEYQCNVELGYVEMVMNNYSKAIEYLNNGYALQSLDPLVLKYLAFYYYIIKDEENACNYFTTYRLITEDLERIDKITDIVEIERYFESDVLFTNLIE